MTENNKKPNPRTEVMRPVAGSSKDDQDAFHVDTALIPQASLEDQSSELKHLGLNVFNQDVFEQGLMNQVDEALAKEEESRLKKILQRELNTISDDIKLAEKDLSRVEEAEASIESLENPNREALKQLESIKRQKRNKIKQLQTLSVRRENVNKKLIDFEAGISSQGNDTFDKAFSVRKGSRSETNQERMVRLGEMTPFGTAMKTQKTKPVHLSGFERALSAKESSVVKTKKDFAKYLKKKSTLSEYPKDVKSASQDSIADQQKDKKEKKRNRFDEKDWRVYDKDKSYKGQRRLCHYNMGHTSSIDEELMDDEFYRDPDEIYGLEEDEDEYVPHKDEFETDSYDDEDYSDETENNVEVGKKRRKKPKSTFKRKQPRPLPVYQENSDEEQPVRTRVKRDRSIRQEKDDADPEAYRIRLFNQQKCDLAEEAKEQKFTDRKKDSSSGSGEESSPDDDSEFEGGLQVPRKLWKKLYKYQKTGVRWLWELHLQQAGGIVGDEMGLGKTIQTISFLAALQSSKVRNVNFPHKGLGPTIIVCPTTVMHQWLKEFHKWWPDFRVAILHSSGSFQGSNSDMVRSIVKSHGVLITSYNTLVIQQELILRFNWHYVILDEGHKIRNPDAKVTLCCKQFRTPHRIILSGSPIQNNLKELWSLFDFVFPGKLGTLPDFMQHFSVPIIQGGYSNATQIQVETAYRCACVLRDTINPYLIRRMKADVKQSLNLPSKNEQVLFCRLTNEQREVYQEYLDSRECKAILQGKFQVFAGLIQLRKICNHPDISTGGPQLFNGESVENDPELAFGYWKRSGKMIVVEALLRLWKKQGHRVLLFSQSKSMLNIMEKFVQERGYSYLCMDGSTAISARQPLISQYNNDTSIYLFLLTTRVGGLGVNLTGADRVIIFDPDWNPSTDIQARERAWRIGQQRQVTIYRLLTSGSIEEKIYHRQIFKQFLTNRILKDPKQRRFFQSQDMYELFTLGSRDNDEGTETSALFAGTDCDVKVPSKRTGRNRFDVINERKENEKAQSGGSTNQDEKDSHVNEDENSDIDKDELERMKELARRLSRKMEEEKQKYKDVKSSSDEDKSSKENKTISVFMKGKNICDTEQGSSRTKQELSQENNLGNVRNSLNKFHTDIHKKKLDNKWRIPSLKKASTSNSKKDSIENREAVDIESGQHNERNHLTKSVSTKSEKEDHDREKCKKRKKRQKDAKFEGEKIPHLDKHCASKPGASASHDNEESEKNRQQDDYVLRELFKKTGIQGAMKHDRIMDASKADFAIVEAEAKKVATEAAAALRRSRQQCASAMTGQPTWTGQHGTVKPRFGQKKNWRLVNNETNSPSSLSSGSQVTNNDKNYTKSEKEKSQLFDGSVSGNVSFNSKDIFQSSEDLLSKMKSRKRISLRVQENDDDDFLRPDNYQKKDLDPKDEELLREIHNYIAFMAAKDGEASTQEIVLNFGKRLPKTDAPKFKAMLNQICNFDRGVWRLKVEYR